MSRQRFNHIQLDLGLWARLKYLFTGAPLHILLRRDGARWVVEGVSLSRGVPVDGESRSERRV